MDGFLASLGFVSIALIKGKKKSKGKEKKKKGKVREREGEHIVFVWIVLKEKGKVKNDKHFKISRESCSPFLFPSNSSKLGELKKLV